jgi:cystathionine beta-lyase
MVASLAAYTEGGDWLDQLVPYIDGNGEFAESFIRAKIPLIKWVKAQGTYLAWLDVSAVIDKIGAKERAAEANKTSTSRRPITPENIAEHWFVQNAKVQINAGSNYGLGGAGHMRMNLATSRKTLEIALNNMASALKKT